MNTTDYTAYFELFSPIEIEMIRLVSKGVETEKIAERLKLDNRAVKIHLSIICDFLKKEVFAFCENGEG